MRKPFNFKCNSIKKYTQFNSFNNLNHHSTQHRKTTTFLDIEIKFILLKKKQMFAIKQTIKLATNKIVYVMFIQPNKL